MNRAALTGTLLVVAHMVSMHTAVAQKSATEFRAMIRESNIRGNVPDPAHFRTFLDRDLRAYFSSKMAEPVSVEYQLLRDEPTQTAFWYPIYFAWVRVRNHKHKLVQGAVKMTAIDKKEFDISDFFSEADIRRDPRVLEKAYPPAACEILRKKVGVVAGSKHTPR